MAPHSNNVKVVGPGYGVTIWLPLLLTTGIGLSHACTTIIVGKNASKTGATFATHTDDAGPNNDPRLILVPAMDWPNGSRRPIYFAEEDYPRAPRDGQEPIGSIPQVKHTLSVFSSSYGIMNEKQVGMGESTCSAVFGTKAIGHGGKALLSIDSLSRIGLERCPTSRCAVQTMGDLAVQYGFYGAGSFEGSAESLMVIDPNEAFIFHVLPDQTGTSAIWVAARVPDNHIGVVANMFTIREVNLSDTLNFLGSNNMHHIAQHELHAWKPSQGLLDFTKVFSDGEYAHKYYSGRRMWGVYHMLASSQGFPDTYEDLKFEHVYPTTAPVDVKVTRDDLFRVHRWYYEGTPYDMTKGVAAGPWGNPDRWNSGDGNVQGSWERTIALHRTTHISVVEARGWLPDEVGGLLWYGPHAPPGTSMIPIAAGMTSVPPPLEIGNPHKRDDSAYWIFRMVFNVMHLNYKFMRVDVNRTQMETEMMSSALVEHVDELYLHQHRTHQAQRHHKMNHNTTGAVVHSDMNDDVDAAFNITHMFTENAMQVLERFRPLAEMLVEKYADGWVNDNTVTLYPDSWLKETNFVDGPGPPPCPPCPCTPTFSPQCSSCCHGSRPSSSLLSSPSLDSSRCEQDMRLCIKHCNTLADRYTTCVNACARLC